MKGWTTVAEAPCHASIRRQRVVSEATGAPAELLSPRTDGALHPAALRRDFIRVHRSLARLVDPALVRVISIFEDDNVPGVVRSALEDGNAAGWSGPLPVSDVAYVGARLLPAVLLAGKAMGGVLLAHDVGIDATGQPVLAPLGPNPNQVDRAVLGAASPESFEGSAPEGTSALYGLGTLLYTLATGRPPAPGNALPPSALNHRVPATLDEAISLLRSTAPERRSLALPLLSDLSRPSDLRRHFTPAATRIDAQTHQLLTTRQPEIPLVLTAVQLASLTPSERSAAVGVAGIASRTLDELITHGLPLILGQAPNAKESLTQLNFLRERHGLPAIMALKPRTSRWTWLALGLVVAAVPAVGGAVALEFGLLPLAIPLAVCAAAIVGLTGWRAWAVQKRLTLLKAVERSRRIQQRNQVSMRQHAGVHKIETRLAQTRVALDQANIAPAIQVDLRGALRDIERTLEPLLELLRATAEVLHQNSRERTVKRLAVLETASPGQHTDERRTLVNTLHHLDAIATQHRTGLDEIDAINAELDRVHHSLTLAIGAST
ncbi:MAG: hypothetical protein GWP91_00515 [Rhodobacterales bacterium]|nr:hypothetical protein [Rhodobacterales bacterium]